MNRFLYIFGLLLMTIGCGGLSAQTLPANNNTTIFDAFKNTKSGEGEVNIDQPNAIRNMVGARQSGVNVVTTEGRSFLKLQGYRVQVYTGNDRTSKDQAFSKEKEIKELFPYLSTYVTFIAPFWRLRVGDYSSHEEAYFMQRQLAQTLPTLAKEMYIVREEVKVPLDYYY